MRLDIHLTIQQNKYGTKRTELNININDSMIGESSSIRFSFNIEIRRIRSIYKLAATIYTYAISLNLYKLMIFVFARYD